MSNAAFSASIASDLMEQAAWLTQQTSSRNKSAEGAPCWQAPAQRLSSVSGVAQQATPSVEQDNGNVGGTRMGYRALTRSLTRTGQGISRADLASPPNDFSASLLNAPDRNEADYAIIRDAAALPSVGDLLSMSDTTAEFRAALHRIRLRPPPPPACSTAASLSELQVAQTVFAQQHPIERLQGLLSSTSRFVATPDLAPPAEDFFAPTPAVCLADTALSSDYESPASVSPEQRRLRDLPHADALLRIEETIARMRTAKSAVVSRSSFGTTELVGSSELRPVPLVVQHLPPPSPSKSELELLAAADSHEHAEVDPVPRRLTTHDHLDLADARADIAILGAKIREEAKVLACELSMDMVPAFVAALSPKRRSAEHMADSGLQKGVSSSNAELLDEVYRLAELPDTVVSTGSSVRNELRRVTAQMRDEIRQRNMKEISQLSPVESETAPSLPTSPAASFFSAPGTATMSHFERRFAEWKHHSPSSPPRSPAPAATSIPKVLPRAQGATASTSQTVTSTLQHVPAFEDVFTSRSPARKVAVDPRKFESDLRDAALVSSQLHSPGTRPTLPPSYTLLDQQPLMADAASFLRKSDEGTFSQNSSPIKALSADTDGYSATLQSPSMQPTKATVRSAVFDFALPQRLSEITPLPAPEVQSQPQSPVYVAVPAPTPQVLDLDLDGLTTDTVTSPLGSMSPAPRLAAPHTSAKPKPSKSITQSAAPESSTQVQMPLRTHPASPLVEAVARQVELPTNSMRVHLESILAPLNSHVATSNAAADFRVGSPLLLRRSYIR